MERMLRKLIQNLGIDAAAQRLGPKFIAQYGPLLGERANDLIREHLPWWPF